MNDNTVELISLAKEVSAFNLSDDYYELALNLYLKNGTALKTIKTLLIYKNK